MVEATQPITADNARRNGIFGSDTDEVLSTHKLISDAPGLIVPATLLAIADDVIE